jgi:hypothetical protein
MINNPPAGIADFTTHHALPYVHLEQGAPMVHRSPVTERPIWRITQQGRTWLTEHPQDDHIQFYQSPLE